MTTFFFVNKSKYRLMMLIGWFSSVGKMDIEKPGQAGTDKNFEISFIYNRAINWNCQAMLNVAHGTWVFAVNSATKQSASDSAEKHNKTH